MAVTAGLAAHGAHVIDRFAAHKVLGIVAGQLEVGYLFHRITGGSAADMRVILHGHDRKVAEGSTEIGRGERREMKVEGIRMAARLQISFGFGPLTASVWASWASRDSAGHLLWSSDCCCCRWARTTKCARQV